MEKDSVAVDFLRFNIALAHLGDLPLRAHHVIALFFKLYGLRLRTKAPQKITPTQAVKISGINRHQLSQAIEDLLIHRVLRRIDANLIEVMDGTERKHSLRLLEKEMGCFVPGTIFDKVGHFYCLNFNTSQWTYDSQTSVDQAVDKFTLDGIAKTEEGLDNDKALGVKALDYFCTKFSATYGMKYKVRGDDMKSLQFIIEKLSLQGKPRDLIFRCMDRTFETMSANSKFKASCKHVLEDFQSGVLLQVITPPPPSDASEFVELFDGRYVRKGSPEALAALQT